MPETVEQWNIYTLLAFIHGMTIQKYWKKMENTFLEHPNIFQECLRRNEDWRWCGFLVRKYDAHNFCEGNIQQISGVWWFYFLQYLGLNVLSSNLEHPRLLTPDPVFQLERQKLVGKHQTAAIFIRFQNWSEFLCVFCCFRVLVNNVSIRGALWHNHNYSADPVVCNTFWPWIDPPILVNITDPRSFEPLESPDHCQRSAALQWAPQAFHPWHHNRSTDWRSCCWLILFFCGDQDAHNMIIICS